MRGWIINAPLLMASAFLSSEEKFWAVRNANLVDVIRIIVNCAKGAKT